MAERYSITNELGRGAIGTVYAARDRSTGSVVALKTLDPALFSESGANLAEVFLKNARSAARLRHRNIVKVLDAGEAGGTVYVAMELLKGESLRQLLDKRPLSIAHAIRIFDDIASALAYAHEEGMVHRGVKPSNIIVLRAGGATLTDFGIGQLGEAAVRYMSPEQVRGDPVDHRSDIFSLGTVLYEMLTRRAPFEGSSAKEIKDNILHAEPPLPSKVNPHVPGALDAMVFRMLAGHPDDRFANVRILLRELQRFEEALGLGPLANVAPRPQPEPQAPQPAPPPAKREPTLGTPAFNEQHAQVMDRERWPERSFGSRVASYAAYAITLAALAIGLGVFLHYSSGTNELPVTAAASPPPPALTPVAETTKQPAPALIPPRAEEKPLPPPVIGDAKAQQDSSRIASTPVAEAIQEPSVAPAAAKPLPPKPVVAEPSPPREAEQRAIAATVPAKEVPRAAQPTAKIPASQGMAKLILAVSPRGDLYIDGKHHGTTPPLTTFDLEPGMHRIEIRSGSWKPFLTYMTVQAGDERRIRHDFAAKPIRPPR